MHYVLITVVLIAIILVFWNRNSGAPDPKTLDRADPSALKDALEGRVDEFSDEEVLDLWTTLRKDMKRRERRGVIFSERLKLEAEHENDVLEEFDRELQRELETLEETTDD